MDAAGPGGQLERIMKIRGKSAVDRAKRKFLYHFPVTRPARILFDHVPKCGGSTLTSYLEAHYPKRKTFVTNGFDPAESVRLFKNMPEPVRHGYELVIGHLANALFDSAHPECLKVTVLRDPVERIVSHYFYAKRTPRHYFYARMHESNMDLDDYLTSNASGELRNAYTTHFSGLAVDEAEQNPEESIAKAAQTILERYDVVGFLDDFTFFVEELRRKANLVHAYQGERVNVSRDRPSIDRVPKSAIEKIQQVNSLDIALYQRIRYAIGRR
jgi:hypothetical protein